VTGGVFITGATGNVGSRLVKEYLEATDRAVFVLVRGEDDAKARERFGRILEFWEVPATSSEGRVHVVRGDIMSDGLGLSDADAARVREEVTLVVHAASNLRLDMPIERARAEILDASKRVFELAQSLKTLERFVYLSTMEVMGGYRGVIRETFLTDYDIPFYNTYEIAKFETEEYLKDRITAGYPITIHRVSMVVGEAVSGKVLRFQSLYLLTEKLILNPDFPVIPDGAPIDAIPCDFLARAIRLLGDDEGAAGRIFHLSQGRDDAITFREYRTMVAAYAREHHGMDVPRVAIVPVGIHRTLFRLLSWVTFGRTRRFFRVQRIFLKFFDLPGEFHNADTKAYVAALGQTWPTFREVFPRLFDYYVTRRNENRLPF